MSIGFARQGRPNIPREAAIIRIVTEADLAAITREQDPFGIAHACRNPGGHVPISLGDHIVCFHCSRIFNP